MNDKILKIRGQSQSQSWYKARHNN